MELPVAYLALPTFFTFGRFPGLATAATNPVDGARKLETTPTSFQVSLDEANLGPKLSDPYLHPSLGIYCTCFGLFTCVYQTMLQ